MNRTRRPSSHWRVSSPGFPIRIRIVPANFPSQPLNSANASPASSRMVGRGGMARWLHMEQKGPCSGALQFRHCTANRLSAVGRPCTRKVDSSGACSLVMRSLPFDGCRRLGAHVVHDAIDAPYLVDDSVGYTTKDVVGELEPVGRHPIHAGDGTE